MARVSCYQTGVFIVQCGRSNDAYGAPPEMSVNSCTIVCAMCTVSASSAWSRALYFRRNCPGISRYCWGNVHVVDQGAAPVLCPGSACSSRPCEDKSRRRVRVTHSVAEPERLMAGERCALQKACVPGLTARDFWSLQKKGMMILTLCEHACRRLFGYQLIAYRMHGEGHAYDNA
jgi:hypothetical protein